MSEPYRVGDTHDESRQRDADKDDHPDHP
jgi:hypothetical protein